ncbi:hypothetical protein AN189_01945 [Loktanella sp. 3ANDIMAR09]|uniref:hypothetical protein n=1 Tax=Loktanella sp. 3ANDIMAR09 TaxID=1225657 RepID=UPI0006FF439F|nr:hypothetical protein [Loktanella sp. 3ANDIMAR09]KQI70175.1 hypothetical protein AN189_01945 [Loktanella sp. 3ANDIMAR09]
MPLTLLDSNIRQETTVKQKWIYALIPLGFVAIIASMLIGGEVVQETTDSPVGEIVEGQGE